MSKTNYMRVVEQTHDEKVKMYMKCTKIKLTKMLIQCNIHLDQALGKPDPNETEIIETKYANNTIVTDLYSGISIGRNTDENKLLIRTELVDNEQGYILAPYVIGEHDDESLKQYHDFMEAYNEQHKYCPNCGKLECSTTFVGYIMNSNKRDEYRDLNSCKCSHCGDVHTKHERVAKKNPNI